MHNGRAKGAPKGNRHALKHGRYSADSLKLAAELRAVLRQGMSMLN